MKYSSDKDDWKKFEKKNVRIARKFSHAKKILFLFQNII